MKEIVIAISLLCIGAAAAPCATAQQNRRFGPDDPYDPYAPPGAAIRALTRRAQDEPGVTRELAPDSRQTATGGPSGGIPGFDGN